MKKLKILIDAKTNTGRKRKNNEDYVKYYMPSDPDILEKYGAIFVVADGVGGNAKGEVASRLACEYIIKFYYQMPLNVSPDKRLKRAIEKVNDLILKKASQINAQGMATTVTAAVIIGRTAFIANVGDSRTYIINPKRKGGIKQITLDHSLVAEQVRRGLLTPEEAKKAPNKNVITRAVGLDPYVQVDLFKVNLIEGDRLLLCSDGLIRVVSDREIFSIVTQNSPQAATTKLISLANSRGGPDNITVCIAEMKEEQANVAAVVVPVVAAMLGLILLAALPLFPIQATSRNVNSISLPKGSFNRIIQFKGDIYVSDGYKVSKLTNEQFSKLTDKIPWGSGSAISACSAQTDSSTTYYISNGKLYCPNKKPPVVNFKDNSKTWSSKTWKAVCSTTGYSDEIILLDSTGDLYVSISKSTPSKITVTDNNSALNNIQIKYLTIADSSIPSAFAVMDNGKLVYGEFSLSGNSGEFVIKKTIGKIVDSSKRISLLGKLRGGNRSEDEDTTIIGIPGGLNNIKGIAVENSGGNEYNIYFLGEGKLYELSNVSVSNSSSASTQPTVSYGTLSVSSTPSGAEIYIDGKDKEKTTPATINNIPVGKHTLTLKKEGYEKYSGPITITANKTKKVNATLKPIKNTQNGNTHNTNPQPTKPTVSTGTLSVNSDPSGAEIYIDGKDKEKTTPATINNIPVGKHRVKLEKDGYKIFSGPITIQEGKEKLVNATLIKLPKVSLVITSVPSGAEIYLREISPNKWKELDDKGVKTPYTFQRVEPKGTYLVVLRKDGYEDYTDTVKINSNAPTYVTANLKSSTGTLSVSSDPSGAEIYIDGKDTGKTTPATINNISVGKHRVKLEKDGYKDYQEDIVIKNGEQKEINPSLTLVHGNIEIDVPNMLKNAKVILDGKQKDACVWKINKDANTNKDDNTYTCILENIEGGSHTVKLEKENFKEYNNCTEKIIDIKSEGETCKVSYVSLGFIKFTTEGCGLKDGLNITITKVPVNKDGSQIPDNKTTKTYTNTKLPVNIIVKPGNYMVNVAKKGCIAKKNSGKKLPTFIKVKEGETIQIKVDDYLVREKPSNGSDAVPPQLQIYSYNPVLIAQTNASMPYSLSISIGIDYSKQVLNAVRDKSYRRFAVPWISGVAEAFYQNKKKGILI